MAEEVPAERDLPSPFMEVTCKSSDKSMRFALGTESGFAVSLINRKLGATAKPVAVYIEAAKEGEEAVHFGPTALLKDYGDGWMLRTVTEIDLSGGKGKRDEFQASPLPISAKVDVGISVVGEPISFLYVAKVSTAFMLIFVLGAILTLALEYLPGFILSLNSFSFM